MPPAGHERKAAKWRGDGGDAASRCISPVDRHFPRTPNAIAIMMAASALSMAAGFDRVRVA